MKNLLSKIYWKIFLVIKYCPFNFCLYLRRYICKKIFKFFGDDCFITDSITISNPKNISFCNRVSVHQYSLFDSTDEIIIGDKVAIGSHCSFITSSHNFNQLNIAIKDQMVSQMKFNIETFKKDKIPEDLKKITPIKPGSRNLSK